MAEQLPDQHPTTLVYVEDEDRFYLVGPLGDHALALPRDVNAHMQELITAPEHRLGCHQGFVKWPTKS